MTSSFEARYRGECDECGQPIEVGDRIRPTGERTYAHVQCPDDQAVSTRRPTPFQGTSTDQMGY